MKRLMNASIVYGVLGLIGVVFYREFTKLNGFTILSVVHTYYLVLGMVLFLLLVVVEKNFHFVDNKVSKYLIFYHIG